MNPRDLPGLRGQITNGLALNREIARSVGFVQVARMRSGAEPASAAALKALFQAAIDYIDAGKITPPGP